MAMEECAGSMLRGNWAIIQHPKFAASNTARISRHRGTLLEFAWMQAGPMDNATIGPA
ncbi:MAG: hypothetical protein ABSD44_08675 [Terracidiphilus sp.]